MREDIEAQIRRQAERDREIEARIARTMRRRRTIWLGSGLLAVVLFGVGGWKVVESLTAPGPTALEYYEYAERYFEQGDLAAAAADLKRVLQLDTDHAEARWLLSRVHLETGDGKAAEKEILRTQLLGRRGREVRHALGRAWLLQRRYPEVLVDAVSRGEQDAAAFLLQCEAQLGLKKVDKARFACDEAVKMAPQDVRALLAGARARLAEGELEGAAEQLSRALSIDGEDTEARLLQGVVAFRGGDVAAAKTAFAAALARTPGHPEAHLGLAQVYLLEEQPEQALAHLNDAHSAAQSESISVPYLKALASLQAGEQHKARNDLRRLLKEWPNHIPSLFVVAAISHAQQEYRQAETLLLELLELSPQRLDAKKLLGSVYLELGEPAAALELLRPTVEQFPEDQEILTLLAEAHRQSGDTQTAAELVERIAELPGDEAAAPLGVALSPKLPAGLLEGCALMVHFCEHCLYLRECL